MLTSIVAASFMLSAPKLSSSCCVTACCQMPCCNPCVCCVDGKCTMGCCGTKTVKKASLAKLQFVIRA